MVEIKEIFDKNSDGFPRYEITDPDKSGSTYTVQRLQFDYPFYEVKISQGSVPEVLQGKYTRHKQLVDMVVNYLEGKREPGPAYKAKRRADAKAAESE